MARLVAPHIGAVHFIRDTCVKKRAASNIRSVSLTAMIELFQSRRSVDKSTWRRQSQAKRHKFYVFNALNHLCW